LRWVITASASKLLRGNSLSAWFGFHAGLFYPYGQQGKHRSFLK
jgi:hypothetical protein